MALRRRQFALCLSLLAVAVAVPVAGCGSDDSSGDITGEQFTEQNEIDFNTTLDKIQGLIDDGLCDDAQQKLETLTGAVQTVPSDTDEGLKTQLLDALAELNDQIGGQCQPAETTTTSTEESSTTTEEEPTTTEETTTTTTESTTTDDTEPTEPTPPETDPGGNEGGGGGTPPGQGGTPPGQGGVIPGSGGTAPGGK